jgi:hypothetical protein
MYGLGFAKSRRRPAGGLDLALVREFQRSTVRVADVAAGEHVILQQRINLSPVTE